MTQPALAFDLEEGFRVYKDPATGRLYPSVTTVISLGRQEQLERWKVHTALEAAGVRLERFTELVADVGPVAAARKVAAVPDKIAARAAGIGDQVHNWLEAKARGEAPGDLSGEAARFQAGAERFLEDYAPKWTLVEATVFNRTLGYAGTADFFAEVNGVRVVGDYKTGRYVHPEVALQLAALARGESIVEADGTEHEVPVADAGIAVHVRPERYACGYCVHDADIGETAWRRFKALLELAKTRDATERLVTRRASRRVAAGAGRPRRNRNEP